MQNKNFEDGGQFYTTCRVKQHSRVWKESNQRRTSVMSHVGTWYIKRLPVLG